MKKFLLITLCLLGLARPLPAEEWWSCPLPDNPKMDGIIAALQNGQTLTEEQMIIVLNNFLLFFKKIYDVDNYKTQKKILYYYYHNQPEPEGINFRDFIDHYMVIDLVHRCNFAWLYLVRHLADIEYNYAMCRSGNNSYCSYQSVWPPLE